MNVGSFVGSGALGRECVFMAIVVPHVLACNFPCHDSMYSYGNALAAAARDSTNPQTKSSTDGWGGKKLCQFLWVGGGGRGFHVYNYDYRRVPFLV
jgi:hypothetical protein